MERGGGGGGGSTAVAQAGQLPAEASFAVLAPSSSDLISACTPAELAFLGPMSG